MKMQFCSEGKGKPGLPLWIYPIATTVILIKRLQKRLSLSHRPNRHTLFIILYLPHLFHLVPLIEWNSASLGSNGRSMTASRCGQKGRCTLTGDRQVKVAYGWFLSRRSNCAATLKRWLDRFLVKTNKQQLQNKRWDHHSLDSQQRAGS